MLTTAGAGLIERRGVTARIAAALEGGSLLLIAGAGYGKTTALRQTVGPPHKGVAWVRCGDAGGDAGRLFALLIGGVRLASPGAADALAEQLAGAGQPIDPARAAGALERELASGLVEPLTIVFDDAETLHGAAATEVIGRLLLSDSALLRVVVATRRRPSIRTARAKAAGRITELGPAELAFSPAECAAYVQQATGRATEPADVEALLATTDGWPLGVALAASGGLSAAAGPSPALARDYFAEEIYSPLGADLRTALLAASIAPDLDVAGRAGLAPVGGFDAAIDRHELFVRPSGSGGGPELHPLFREFLRARFAAEVPPEEQRRVAGRIGRALEVLDRSLEAIDYHIAARDWQQASIGIAREGPALVRTASDTVTGWIEALPSEHACQPEVQLLAGSLAHGQGRFAEAIELCRSAADGLDREAAPSERRFAARFALADVLMAAGDLEGVARQAAVLDEPDAVGNLAARAVGVVAAAGLARAGRFEQGRAVFERALDDPSARALAALEPTFHGYYLELPAGRLDQALAHARRAVSMLEVSDPFGRLPYALTYLMAILEERGEDSEALAVAQRTRAWSQRVGLSGWVGVALAIRSASLRGRSGDVAGAEADLAEVPAEWPVWGEWELEATRAAIDVLHGEGARACAAADRAMDQAERRWPYFDRARCAALLAPTLVSAGHPERAREIVQRTLAGRLPGFSTARLQAVLAWLLHDEGDERASMDALAAAWNEGADQIKHTIRREWPRIERPIWVALEHGAIEIDTTVQALAAAEPGAAALAGFTRHPVAAVRRAALLAAVASGHPQGLERIAELRADPDPTVVRAVNAVAERLVRAPLPLTFRLLGGFGLRRGTWEVQDAEWERRVAQRLIRLLLCRGCGPVLEDELIEAFWPDKTAESARRSIQVAVSAARAVLDPPGAGRSRLVCSERAYRLELTARDTVDAGEFERAASVALAAPPHARRSALLAAAALWTGEPLPEERYSEWSTGWRERLRDRYREVLAALSTAHEHAGYMHEAVAAARAMVELDPLDEAAHRRLIVAFARTGRRGHALRQFLECRRTLVTELGVEPGEETARLQRRVLAGESV